VYKNPAPPGAWAGYFFFCFLGQKTTQCLTVLKWAPPYAFCGMSVNKMRENSLPIFLPPFIYSNIFYNIYDKKLFSWRGGMVCRIDRKSPSASILSNEM